MKCPCKKHPRYLAKRAPRANCEPCWAFFRKVRRERFVRHAGR